MRDLPANSVDLVFTSPPYEIARTYGIGFGKKGWEWVNWYIPYVKEMLRVCTGLVAIVVQGQTRNFRWSATPAKLAVTIDYFAFLRNPCIFARQGISGSGGPDWLRSDYEWIICATKYQGRLPWSDTLAMGWPCKYPQGGTMSHRTKDGNRTTRRSKSNGRPPITNPGNIIKLPVGKSHMGSDLAHENEAPFPERLAEFFVRSFCPPDGIVLDPMCGSGSALAAASQFGRSYIGYDIRQSQVDLARKRLSKGSKNESASKVLRSR